MLSWLALSASLGVAPHAVAPQPGGPFPRIANCYGVGLTPDSTPEDIEAIARFDLLIGGVWANWQDADSRARLAANIAAVRARNPHAIILDFSSSAPYADPNDATFPATGWLLQADGRRIEGWPGTQMINLTKPEVLDWLAARSVASVREKGFDGTFIDCMSGGFDSWACNIAGGDPYTVDANGDGRPDDPAQLDAAWVAAKTELSRRVREALGPDVPFMTNQAGEWGFPYMNGILLEDYLDYVLAGTMRWDDVLQTYLHWTAAPHAPNLTTIVSSSGLEPPYDPWRAMDQPARDRLLEQGRTLYQRMRFGLTTTLMGDGYYAYDLHTRWRGQRWWYLEYDAPLGYPRGTAEREGDGTWRRQFDGGTVIVNPTPFDTFASFPELRLEVSSGKVANDFVIPARDGRLFLPTDLPRAAGALPDPTPLLSLSGPEPAVERDGVVLLRLGPRGASGHPLAALLDAQGRLLTITDGAQSLLEQLRPEIVADDRWRDFPYAECEHDLGAAGELLFSGRRGEGEAALSFRQAVRPVAGGLEVRYHWEALADVHVHAWRQQADFPVAVYGGGTYQTDAGAAGQLPRERAPQPQLTGPFRRIALTGPGGGRVTVELSGDGFLVDERHYGVPAFRLGYYPATGDLAAGQAWDYRLRLRAQ